MSDATIILRAAICSQHFDEGCLSCRSARECSDRELDRLRSNLAAARLEGVRTGLEAAIKAAEPVVTVEQIPAREYLDENDELYLAPSCTRTITDINAVARIKAIDPASIASSAGEE